MSLVTKPNAEIVAPAMNIVRPMLPRNFAAASASGASVIIRKIGTERSLGDELDQNVYDRCYNKREISRTRNGARRIFNFTAWNQRDFDSDECEHQQNDASPNGLLPGHAVQLRFAR